MSSSTGEQVRAVFLAALMVLSVVAMTTAFAGSAAAQADGSTLVVDKANGEDNGESPFATIQAAVDAAEQDDSIDTIVIHSGTYHETVTVDVEGLTLKAANGANPVIKNELLEGGGSIAAGGDVMIRVTAKNVTVRGLTVETTPSDGAPPGAIVLEGDGSEAINNDVSHNPVASGHPLIGGSGDEITIDGNNVTDGPIAYYGSGSAEIVGNTIDGEIANEAIWSTTSGEITVKNNDLSDAVIGVGTSGAETSVKFTEESVTVNGETGSEAILAAVGGNNTGSETVEIAGELFATDGSLTVEDGESIQAAINRIGAFTNADTVQVGPGTYNESVTIDTANVTLESTAGADETTINATGANRGVDIASADVTVSGFTINGSANDGVVLQNDANNAEITNNVIQNVSDVGFQSFGGASDVTVSDNEFVDNNIHVLLAGTGGGAENYAITGNDFTNSTEADIVLNGAAVPLELDDIEVTNNNFEADSTAIAKSDQGEALFSGTLDATSNWWGNRDSSRITSTYSPQYLRLSHRHTPRVYLYTRLHTEGGR